MKNETNQNETIEQEVYPGTVEYYKRELKDVNVLYASGVKMTGKMWASFNVFFVNKENKLERIYFNNEQDKDQVPSHWKFYNMTTSKGGYFNDTVFGMDRVFDIVYSIGTKLFNNGYKFKDEFLSYGD